MQKKKKEEPKKQNWTPPTLNVYCSKMGILPGTTKHNKKCKSKKKCVSFITIIKEEIFTLLISWRNAIPS